MLTPYQFASNRPIDGIDLDGMEYLSASFSRIEVIRGNALFKVSNANNLTWNNFWYANSQNQNWSTGSLGIDRSIATLDIQSFSPRAESDFNGADGPGYGDIDPATIAGQIQIPRPRNNDGTFDMRHTKWESRKLNGATQGGAKGMGAISVVINLSIMYGNWQIDNDNKLVANHSKYLEMAVYDVNSALAAKNVIPNEFQDVEALSDITNYVLQGESYLKKIGDKRGDKIIEIGKKVVDEFSSKRKKFTGNMLTIRESSGAIIMQTQELNSKYDPSYGKTVTSSDKSGN
jgi:hypothetical protein